MKPIKILFSLVLVLLSCRSAQQLVDKAVRKDPSIVLGKVDTLHLSHFYIDSVQVVKNDTIVWEKVTVEVKFDTIIRSNRIFIERKKSKMEVRKEFQLANKVLKYENKIARLEAKLSSKNERVEVRAETKKQRIRSRWWFWFVLGLSLGLIINLLIKLFWKTRI